MPDEFDIDAEMRKLSRQRLNISREEYQRLQQAMARLLEMPEQAEDCYKIKNYVV